MSDKITAAVTGRIIAAIEAGEAKAGDWRMPWHRPAGSPVSGAPINGVTRKAYRGINRLNLYLLSSLYPSQKFASYKQWGGRGIQVQAGEKGIPVCYWDQWRPKDAAPEDRARWFLKLSHVFAAEQTDMATAAPDDAPVAVVTRQPHALETVLKETGCQFRTNAEGRAFYAPSFDVVSMPAFEAFDSEDRWLGTLAHECAHATGHESRLAREFGKRFGDSAYAVEELTAELAAAFATAEYGVGNPARLDHAQYCASWLAALKAKPEALITAAGKAEAAASWIVGRDRPAVKIAA